MKFWRITILLAIVVFLLFFYRTELANFVEASSEHRGGNTLEQTSWAGLREKAHVAFGLPDAHEAIPVLEDYLPVVQEELRHHDNNDTGLVTTRHDVVCELSLVYNKLSNCYYQLGDEEHYYFYLTRYRDYLKQCTEKLTDQDE